jgi:hypothetical protein
MIQALLTLCFVHIWIILTIVYFAHMTKSNVLHYGLTETEKYVKFMLVISVI